MQEATDADLLLHVIDAANPAWAEQQGEVDRVLDEIGASDVPQLLVFNKCDLLEESRQPRAAADWIEVHSGLRRRRVFVSARSGEGLDVLRQRIAETVEASLLNRHATASPDPRFTELLDEAQPDGLEPDPLVLDPSSGALDGLVHRSTLA